MAEEPIEAYRREEPSKLDILRACDVLLNAGFTEEGLSVLTRVVQTRHDLLKILREPRYG
jgi:hypothetical protein